MLLVAPRSACTLSRRGSLLALATLLSVAPLTAQQAGLPTGTGAASAAEPVHVWEMQEITLTAAADYENPYTEVSVWVELRGPDFERRVYGFWDGGKVFRVRVVATAPGEWSWMSGSNQPGDAGLNGRSGSFTAVAWTEAEMEGNPVRRGFLRPSPGGHALQHADGSPYFMVGDTWLSGSTWRLPFRNAAPPAHYQPGPGIGFEDAVQYRKRQGFNSVSMIAAFPNWEADYNPSTFADSNGIYLRNAWEKFGYDVAGASGTDASGGSGYWGSFTAKSMRDEYGNPPFLPSREHAGVSDFDRIEPAYFRSLDRKVFYLAEQGFIPLLETVRRDAGPSWNAYFEFDESYARYVQYLVARYGASNIVFSGIHLDWIPRDFSLTAEQFNRALTHWMERYGGMPFGQPVTVLISSSTYGVFGHGAEVPWLTMHSVGNKPRDHRVADSLAVVFELDPPYPAINFEPYYTGWDHEINRPGGERPAPDSERDNYFARAQMYGSVLAGGLSGHVHGTAAYDITSTGEPSGARPHIWDALRYQSATYMRPLRDFILSRGADYQRLELAREDLLPNAAAEAPADGLDGWSYMMRTPEGDLAFLYLEHAAELPELRGFRPGAGYRFQWYQPATGEWLQPIDLRARMDGTIGLPGFPAADPRSYRDWAARLLAHDR